jgi:oligopeptide transport system substrate-binding protein
MILRIFFFFLLVFNGFLLGEGTESGELQVLKRSNQVEPESIDPHKILGFYESQVIHDLFEGLVSYGPKGEIMPALAESWEITDDGKEYRFFLREARWSNGELISAHDAVASFRRLMDPSTGAPNAFMFYGIKNAYEINTGKITDLGVLGVIAETPNILVIKLNAPKSYFLDLLAHRAAVILSRKQLQENAADWATPAKMITNGPYQLSEWVPLSHIMISKSPTYWDNLNVNMDVVYYYTIEDRNQEYQRFQTKSLDMTTDVPIEKIAMSHGPEYHESPGLLFYFLAFNMSKPGIKDNLFLRKALSMALDRETLINSVMKGAETPAYSIVPKGIPGYIPEEINFNTNRIIKNYRVDQARGLYQKAGFNKDNPLKMEILYNSDAAHKKNLIAISGMWKDVFGSEIEITFKEVEWKVYLQMRNSGDFAMARAGWVGDYPHPSSFLEVFSSTFSSQNPCKYKNREFEILLEQAANAATNKGAFNFFKQAERVLLEQHPLIPIFHGKRRKLVNSKLFGYEDNVIDIHRSKYLSWKDKSKGALQ